MRKAEQFVLDMGSYRITVTRKRVKNVNFRIGSNGEALMSIPARTSRAEAERIARDHAAWFEQALARSESRKGVVPENWTTGELLNVWGTPTRLRVVGADETRTPCELVNGELVVRDGDGSAHWRFVAVEKWLRQQLTDRLDELMFRCQESVGAKATSITVRRMKTRWGSCTPSTGRIRINTALAECPPACTETVLIHELCHLRVSNHGPQFKALMDLCCPGWRATQRWLDEHPPTTR